MDTTHEYVPPKPGSLVTADTPDTPALMDVILALEGTPAPQSAPESFWALLAL